TTPRLAPARRHEARAGLERWKRLDDRRQTTVAVLEPYASRFGLEPSGDAADLVGHLARQRAVGRWRLGTAGQPPARVTPPRPPQHAVADLGASVGPEREPHDAGAA